MMRKKSDERRARMKAFLARKKEEISSAPSLSSLFPGVKIENNGHIKQEDPLPALEPMQPPDEPNETEPQVKLENIDSQTNSQNEPFVTSNDPTTNKGSPSFGPANSIVTSLTKKPVLIKASKFVSDEGPNSKKARPRPESFLDDEKMVKTEDVPIKQEAKPMEVDPLDAYMMDLTGTMTDSEKASLDGQPVVEKKKKQHRIKKDISVMKKH